MPIVMAALSNIGGALCSTPQSLADAQSRLNVLGGPGPARLMGPPWERVSGVGAIVPCTR